MRKRFRQSGRCAGVVESKMRPTLAGCAGVEHEHVRKAQLQTFLRERVVVVGIRSSRRYNVTQHPADDAKGKQSLPRVQNKVHIGCQQARATKVTRVGFEPTPFRIR